MASVNGNGINLNSFYQDNDPDLTFEVTEPPTDVKLMRHLSSYVVVRRQELNFLNKEEDLTMLTFQELLGEVPADTSSSRPTVRVGTPGR